MKLISKFEIPASVTKKDIFACLFSVHNTISSSHHEQVCLMRLHFEIYFSDDGRGISRNVASLNIIVHDVWTYCIITKKGLPIFSWSSLIKVEWPILT